MNGYRTGVWDLTVSGQGYSHVGYSTKQILGKLSLRAQLVKNAPAMQKTPV